METVLAEVYESPDSSVPPFTQAMPVLKYDLDGNAWVQYGPSGGWTMVNQSQPQQPQPLAPAPYIFPTTSGLSASTASSSHAPTTTPFPIDTALLSLPNHDDDDDLIDPAAIAKSIGLKPALKVGGARQKGKGKKRDRSPEFDASVDEAPRKRGRPKGSPNWKQDEVDKLLDCVEARLPIGSKGWKEVAEKYLKWAQRAKRTERDQKALEAKYRKILAQKKPTGDSYCPPHIKRAHRIEGMIASHAGSRDLSDDDLADSDAGGAADDHDDDDSDNSVEVIEQQPILTAVAQRAPSPPLRKRQSRNAPAELITKLSDAFDPDVLKSRDADRAQRSFQTTHMFTLSQQLRDAQAANDSLRNQMMTLQSRVHEAERARDRAELKLEFLPQRMPRSGRKTNNKMLVEHLYADGACTETFSLPNSDDESDKENHNPSTSSSSRPRSTSSPFNLSSSSGSSALYGMAATDGEVA